MSNIKKPIFKDTEEDRDIGILTRKKLKTNKKLEKPRKYNVVILNDDFTPMDFVVHIMMETFHKNQEDAVKITMTIHTSGKWAEGPYSYDVAETKVLEVMNLAKVREYPLRCVIQEV